MTDDIETLKRSLRESWASEKRLAAERDQLRGEITKIRQASLTWAMTCEHDCPACNAMFEIIKGAQHPTGEPK